MVLMIYLATTVLKQSVPKTSTRDQYISRLLQHQGRVNNDSEDRPLLVDVTEMFLSGWTTENDTEKQQLFSTSGNVTHKILWYNPPDWISTSSVNRCLNTCSYKNCESVTDITLIRHSSAVIFCITTKGIEKTPPLEPSERPVDQVWVFFAMESPIHLDRYYSGLRPTWTNSLNWSMNYRVDSDIIIPYGYLTSRKTLPERNYTEIFRTKKKFAAWVVSNCGTVSLREKFVEKMKKYGLEIDVYGVCGQKLSSDPKEMISKTYKFYLSFENSFCSDYITEKLFGYYNLNTVMIVRGGSDYKRLLPHDTYINTAEFNSFEELVAYLKHVGSNETLYIDYLKRKDKFDSFPGITDTCPSFCALCRKLNNLDTNRKIYKTVPKYLETCYKPDDINKMEKNWF